MLCSKLGPTTPSWTNQVSKPSTEVSTVSARYVVEQNENVADEYRTKERKENLALIFASRWFTR